MRAFIAGVLGTIAFVALPSSAFAASCTAASSGSWTAAGTWSCSAGTYPGQNGTTDSATIGAGFTVTVDSLVDLSGAAGSLSLSGTLDTGTSTLLVRTLTVPNPATVTGNGRVTVSAGGLAVGDDLTVGVAVPALGTPGTSVVVTSSGSLAWTKGQITVLGGATLSPTGGASVASGSSVSVDDFSLFTLGGTYTLAGSFLVSGPASIANASTLRGPSGTPTATFTGGSLSFARGTSTLAAQVPTTFDTVNLISTGANGGSTFVTATAPITLRGGTTSSGTGTISLAPGGSLLKPIDDHGVIQLTWTISGQQVVANTPSQTVPESFTINGGTLRAPVSGYLGIVIGQGAQLSDSSTSTITDGSSVTGAGIFAVANNSTTGLTARFSLVPANGVPPGTFTPALLDLGAFSHFTLVGATSRDGLATTVAPGRILVNNSAQLIINDATPAAATPFHVVTPILGIHFGEVVSDLFTDIDIGTSAQFDSASIGVPITTHGVTTIDGNMTLDQVWTVPTGASIANAPLTTIDGIGRILLSGGSMHLGGDLEVAGLEIGTGGSLDLAGSKLQIALGVGSLAVDVGGLVTGAGTVDASIDNAGSLTPSGLLTITGTLKSAGTVNAASNLVIHSGATITSGTVAVHGNLWVDGGTDAQHNPVPAPLVVTSAAVTVDSLSAAGDVTLHPGSPLIVTGVASVGGAYTGELGSSLSAASLTVTGALAATGSPITLTGDASVGVGSTMRSLTLSDSAFSAASLAVTGTISLAGTSSVVLTGTASAGGDLTMTGDSGSLRSAGLTVGGNVAARGTFTIAGPLSVTGSLTGTGTLTLTLPGAPSPASRVTGPVSLVAGRLVLHGHLRAATYAQDADSTLVVALRSASDLDQVTSDGATTLAGDLEVSSAGYDPAAGATARVISSGAPATGTFATITAPITVPVNNGRSWEILDYATAPVTLTLHYSVPINDTPPRITGVASVGQPLTCTGDVWTNTPLTFRYSFAVDGVFGAPSSTNSYSVMTGDVGKTITCRIAATNPNPGSPVSVDALNSLVVRPWWQTDPTIGPGAAVLGAALTCTPGNAVGATQPVTYVWTRDNVMITNATTPLYTTTTADVGHALVCQVTATGVSNTSTVAVSSGARVAVGLLVTKTILDKAGKLGFKTTCLTVEGSCAGTIVVKVAGKVVATVRVSGAGTRVTKVKLPAALKAKLAAGKTVSDTLVYSYHDAPGHARQYQLGGKLHR